MWGLGIFRVVFQFENWWLEVDGFKARMEECCSSFQTEGRSDNILACKLKSLKVKLKEWNANNYGNLKIKKIELLNQLSMLEDLQELRALTEDEFL